MEDRIDDILAALYAPGIGAATPRRWPAVVRALRRDGGASPDALALAREGFDFESLLVQGAIDRPANLLTAVDDRLGALWPLANRIARGLPASAVEVSLDAPALPPALWISGELPGRRAPTLAGIGCRVPSTETRAFARAVGRRAMVEDVALISGGADGCDTAFSEGHGASFALLPYGLDGAGRLPGVAARLSVFPRSAPFARERAMRRNSLIVAAADLTLVASARLREGGSWHAAVGALRRRAPLAVYVGPGEGSGARSLVALGGLPVRDPEEALAALALVRDLGPNEDAAACWSQAQGSWDERLQPLLGL